ncbi:vomeronasal type 1 receptor 6-like [Scleropages formosus]|uniref:Vomeronasal type 1 receptor 6-like n=1 Tax=Scleropages formosus TaxID=113540 RepID=A0A0P7UB28_SCLFO|nr:uncharacterized protein LOC108920831 [Scleropages formosus]KPP56910.1 vomeronasal type 1 receptor 6-like [Scleropages formosus]
MEPPALREGNGSSALSARLEQYRDKLLVLQLLISFVGVVGNIILVISIFSANRLKTFEIFLLGLATSNLVEILVVDVYDIIIVHSGSSALVLHFCSTLRFLKLSGETATMQFTVLICVFRYQKLQDARTRVKLPVALDSIVVARTLSGASVLLALILGIPTYFMNLDQNVENTTRNENCALDIFQCPKRSCPTLHVIYKSIFLVLLTLLPFLIVTVTSGLIIRILLVQQRTSAVQPARLPPQQQQIQSPSLFRTFHRSTIAVLAAMALCQVAWALYLMLHLVLDPYTFQFWPEAEFYITTTYATVSPYVYGIGNNLFSLKCCVKVN